MEDLKCQSLSSLVLCLMSNVYSNTTRLICRLERTFSDIVDQMIGKVDNLINFQQVDEHARVKESWCGWGTGGATQVLIIGR